MSSFSDTNNGPAVIAWSFIMLVIVITGAVLLAGCRSPSPSATYTIDRLYLLGPLTIEGHDMSTLIDGGGTVTPSTDLTVPVSAIP